MNNLKGRGRIMIIGAGGVATVAAHKCSQVPEVFKEIMLASRTFSKCEAIRDDIRKRYGRDIQAARVDADNVPELAALIKKFQPDLLLNLALPYQDLHIMDACLETGVHYMDTANCEPPDVAHFEYSWQWAYQEKFRQRGIMALLGSGFDPGVTNVFTAYAQKHLFDEIHYLDILDCNAGTHGHVFATNFNPEINIREVTQTVRHWENGKWILIWVRPWVACLMLCAGRTAKPLSTRQKTETQKRLSPFFCSSTIKPTAPQPTLTLHSARAM